MRPVTEGLPTWSSQDGVWLQIEGKKGIFVPAAFGLLLELPECLKPKVLWIARVYNMLRQLPQLLLSSEIELFSSKRIKIFQEKKGVLVPAAAPDLEKR